MSLCLTDNILALSPLALTWHLFDSAYSLSLSLSVQISCLILFCWAIGQNSFIHQPIKETHIQKDNSHQPFLALTLFLPLLLYNSMSLEGKYLTNIFYLELSSKISPLQTVQPGVGLYVNSYLLQEAASLIIVEWDTDLLA